MNRSPERNSFQRNTYLDRCRQDGVEPSEAYLEMFDKMAKDDQDWENDPEKHKNDLEYDLRTTPWICDKAKANENYAQNIYAALCNRSWQRNDVWPRLKDETWSCSWRYAGGIVADMIEQGDYIDWYCSGIRGGDEPDVYNNVKLPGEFVSESTVTDEIRADFFKLGWIPVENNENE